MSLISRWKLNDTSGVVVADSVGSNNGEYNGAPLLNQVGIVPVYSDSCPQFDGVNDFVDLTKIIEAWSGCTQKFWVQPSTKAFHQLSDFGAGPGVWLTAAGEVKAEVDPSETTAVAIAATSSYSAGQLLCIHCTYASGRFRLYINGVKVKESTTPKGTITNTAANGGTLGANGARSSGFLSGKLARVELWDSEMSEVEVLNDFNTDAVFAFSLSGVSASSGSEVDELILVDSVSGSSASSGEAEEMLVFEEPLSGTSNSLGDVITESGELVAMTLSGSSTSTGSETDSYEASDQISGASNSTGSSVDVEEAIEKVSGESSSTGAIEFSFSIVDSVSGLSASSFSIDDEAIATEGVAGSSASSGSSPESTSSDEALSGNSNSTGSSSMTVEDLDPDQPKISPIKKRQRQLSVDWRLFLCDSDTMELLGEIKQARGRQFQLALNKPGGCNFSVPLNYDLFKDVEEINHGVIAYRNKVPRFSGMVWNLDEQTQSNSIAVQCLGWFETLNHRLVREDIGYPPFSAGTINGGQIVFLPAQGTVGGVNYHPGGLLTIANAQRDTWISEGTNKDIIKRIISYQKGQNIGQAISQLTEVEAGFDFEIDPESRVMDIKNWNEVPDKSEEVVFGHNWGPSNIEDLGRQFDPSVMANRVTALGKYGGGFAEDLEAQEEYQLFEEMPQLGDVVDPNVLLGYAGGEVLLRGRPRTLYSFKPFPYARSEKVPQPFEDYDLGDIISFTAIQKPRIEIMGQAVRVYGINIDVTDEGNEKVSALQISP